MTAPLLSPDQLTPELVFLIEHLDLGEAVGDPDARWEAFQLENLNNSSLLAIETKSRQVGWSWLSAARAVARGSLKKRHTSLFVSINQEEAGEKIRYAKQVIESLDRAARPKLIVDNRFELEFENGSRMISHPCRPVRGKARADVYLDEFAHYPKDREIYQSAVPVISKGGGIRIGSSPLGAQGLFWEIYAQRLRSYPGYVRNAIPWWVIQAFCVDVKLARLVAPKMDTDERVRRFGTKRLIEIYENLPLEDFCQEYECAWVDEAVAYIEWELIKANQMLDQAGKHFYRHVTGVGERVGQLMTDIEQAISDVAEAVRAGQVEPALTAGMDVGRVHDLSEITLTGKSTTGHLPVRMMVSLQRMPYDEQRTVARKIMDQLPVIQMLIDRNGLGNQMAEELHNEYSARVEGVDFTAPSKALWAVELKVQMERRNVPIPLHRDLTQQIHSIRKVVTAAKNTVFDVAASERHHADKFWSLALAVWAAREANKGTTTAQTAKAVVVRTGNMFD